MRRIAGLLVGATIALALAVGGGCRSGSEAVETAPGGAPTYRAAVRSLLTRRCTSCHAGALAGGRRRGAPRSVDLDTYEHAVRHAERSSTRIQRGTMPPSGVPLPTAERTAFARWVEAGTPQ